MYCGSLAHPSKEMLAEHLLAVNYRKKKHVNHLMIKCFNKMVNVKDVEGKKRSSLVSSLLNWQAR